ncbi:dihydroneopterin triphosphate diphosphatase [Rhodoferax lacus]|uniref:Dihydroneopterin triphosphate diphosphatase n=1 Tax=Rhodoferax lacus TaxID=2184758 RepID=A0A3E1RFP4_9BURK|nr:dihydroneopterin triphosphate diphosphatase [Rhodoferax lacus]RFO98051.1 dihydroneopterin triphosphate diphosphatase [Rhodoferax lacus]
MSDALGRPKQARTAVRCTEVFLLQPFKIPLSVLVVIYTPALDVLLIRRADTDDTVFWQSVTGSKDALEHSFAETAMREVLEETGIDCSEGSPLHSGLQDWELENVYNIYPRWLHRYAPGTVFNTERVFGLQVPAGTLVTLSPREHTHYQWLPFVDAAAQCYSPSNAEAILMLPRFAGALGKGQSA